MQHVTTFPIETFWAEHAKEMKFEILRLYKYRGETSSRTLIVTVTFPAQADRIMRQIRDLAQSEIQYLNTSLQENTLIIFQKVTEQLIQQGIYSPIIPLLRLAAPSVRNHTIPGICQTLANTTTEHIYQNKRVAELLPPYNQAENYRQRSLLVHRILDIAVSILAKFQATNP